MPTRKGPYYNLPDPASSEPDDPLLPMMPAARDTRGRVSDEVVLAAERGPPDGRLRVSQISDRLVANRPGVTRLIDGLAERGLVERQAAEGDRRGINAAVTEAGRDLFARGAPIVLESLDRQIGDCVDTDEVRAMQAAFAKILTRLASDDAGCGAKVVAVAKTLSAKTAPSLTPTETTA